MDILINILEVASELAEKKVLQTIMHTTGCTIEEAAEEAFEEIDNELRYTEAWQDTANEYYDEYYEFLLNLQEKNSNFAFGKQLASIVEEYKAGDTEPLDCDEVDRLSHVLKTKLNLMEGNITSEEYDKLLN